MNTHEYQAKEILKRYGLPIPDFGVASSFSEAEQVVQLLNLTEAVVKIQVHAGGRGKAGGVKFAKSKEEILSVCKELLGMKGLWCLPYQRGRPGRWIDHQELLSPPQRRSHSLKTWLCSGGT